MSENEESEVRDMVEGAVDNTEMEWRKEALDQVLEGFEEKMISGTGLLRSVCIPLDRAMFGLNPGNLAMIVGKAYSGKSGLAGSIFIKSVIQSDIAGVFFSSEKSDQQQLSALIHARAEYRHCYQGKPPKEALRKMKEAIDLIMKSNFALRDSRGLTVFGLQQTLINIQEELDVRVVVIDGLDFLRMRSDSPLPTGGSSEELTKIIIQLKCVAKVLDVVILFTMNDLGECLDSPLVKNTVYQLVDLVMEVGECEHEKKEGFERLHAIEHGENTHATSHLVSVTKNRDGQGAECHCSINPEGLYTFR